MFTIRFQRANSGSTTQASADAIALLRNPKFKVAVFSTSLPNDDGTATSADGPSTNWPYFSAAIRVDDHVHIFDSTLLNAARVPRDREVRDVLDVAQQLQNVFFTTSEVAGFTASLPPELAARRFSERQLAPLTPNTRSHFWLMVARGTPEGDFDRLRGK